MILCKGHEISSWREIFLFTHHQILCSRHHTAWHSKCTFYPDGNFEQNSVAITRGNSGGQIYNAISETQSEKNSSPIGTEWAIGDTSNIESLTFEPFRSAVGSPQSVVGKKLVLHIIEEDVYMSVEFTSWASGQAGGFAYIRSSEN